MRSAVQIIPKIFLHQYNLPTDVILILISLLTSR